MATIMQTQGNAPFRVPAAGKDCFTWYKVFGDLNDTSSSESIPLVGVHGGPGAGHEYLLKLEDLWTGYGIPVILYDQLGCGKSTALPEKDGDESFWTEELFRNELASLAEYLQLKEYDFIGHSWGGMLGANFAATQPRGLRKLILMGTPASSDLIVKAARQLQKQLPQHVQDTLALHERNETFDDPDYKEACLEFYKRFLCRLEIWPEELNASLAHLGEGPVYKTMFGPSELLVNGGLRNWTAIPNAHNIHQSTLLINGAYDEIAEFATAPLFERIARVKWVVLPKSAHMGMWEEPDRFCRVVAEFLR